MIISIMGTRKAFSKVPIILAFPSIFQAEPSLLLPSLAGLIRSGFILPGLISLILILGTLTFSGFAFPHVPFSLSPNVNPFLVPIAATIPFSLSADAPVIKVLFSSVCPIIGHNPLPLILFTILPFTGYKLQVFFRFFS